MNDKIKAFFAVFPAFFLFFSAFEVSAETRKAFFAGKFYPEKREELAKTVDKAVSSAEIKISSGEIIALIAPHAGYEFSAGVAGYAYKAVAGKKYDTVVILATAHTMSVEGGAVYAAGEFETPLGKLKVDEALARKLLKETGLFSENTRAHSKEHAVEVQLPFLQRTLAPGFKILPIVMNTDSLYSMRRAGEFLAGALKGKKALIVISSDLSHYPEHGTAKKVDETTLLALKTLDPEYFWLTNRILMGRGEKDLGTAWCGEAAVLAGMSAAAALGADEVVELKYADSYDENKAYGNPSGVVGYAAVLFKDTKEDKRFKPELSRERKDFLLKLARETVSAKLEGKEIKAGLSGDYFLNLPGAVFVTLTKNGVLRGCVGSIQPRSTIHDAVIYSALAAAFEDGRFTPLKKEELGEVKMEISLLSPLKKVKGAGEILPGKHGVVIMKDSRSGLFLPQVWEQIPDKTDFLEEICSQKAGLKRDCWKDKDAEIYVFTVDAFEED